MRAVMNDHLQYVAGGWRVRIRVPADLWQIAAKKEITQHTGIYGRKDDKAKLNEARAKSHDIISKLRHQLASWKEQHDWPNLAFEQLYASSYTPEAALPEPAAAVLRKLLSQARSEQRQAAVVSQRCDPDVVITAWIAERGKTNRPKPRSVENKRSKLARMFAFLSGETKLDRFTAAEIDQWLAAADMAAVTASDLRRYYGHLRGLGDNICFDHMADLRALFNVAHKHGLILGENPGEKIKLPKKPKNTRQRFTMAEARTILNAARINPDPIIKWFNLLAAFTGTITEEILYANVFQEEGVWVISIQPPKGENLKTVYRPRTLPLHPRLIAEGFLDYLASLPDSNLFPMLDGKRREAKASKKLMAFIRSLGITEKTKTFYSWRHSVASELDNVPGITTDRARFICGHAPVDVHARNYKHPSIPELVENINGLPDPLARS